MGVAIKVENLSKAYQLGEIGTGTLSRDLERYWAKLRGKEDPFLKIGEINDRTVKSESDIVWSLKDINFDIEQGDAVGIIGRNGAGKSTLLKILSRVTSPTTGNIKVKGRVASLLEVGTGFHPELSGRENIFLNGAILGMRKAEIKKHFDAIVDFSGVERYIDTPVKRYSSGMYVRLAFAVAAHLESEILVVDEVLAVGDAEFQKKCLGKMNDVSKGEGRTVLFVSHNMASINNLCAKSILLNNGKLDFFDSTEKTINQYLKTKPKWISIKDRTDREGDQKIKLFRVDFLDTNYNKLKNVSCGDDFIISLVFKKSSMFNPSKIEIGLGIDNLIQERLTLISNKISGEDIIMQKGIEEFEVKILIKKFSLAIGEYNITTFISSNENIHDWIKESFTLNIEFDKFFNTQFIIPKEQGQFYLNYNFLN